MVVTLLIHSMSELSDIILSGLEIADARHVAEIGAEFGGMSQLLADFTAARDGSLTSIDPTVKPQFTEWLSDHPNVRHIAQPSLEAIGGLSGIDAWLVDGDHNYYTVYHELRAIDAVCGREGKPLLAFLHDVNWPWARRDLYYAPDQIPAEWRHPFDYDGGVSLDTDQLLHGRGFRGHGQFAVAVHSGGPRNGVLTAVEDFLEEARRDGREIAFAFIPAVFGLGVVFDCSAAWGPALADALMPFHQSRLLQTLEENRLRNYLKVIEFQDGLAA